MVDQRTIPIATTHVAVHGVTKRYGGTVALDAVDLMIEVGTVHALVGENGAGKSTLGKIIAGVISPDEGMLEINGRAVRLKSPRAALDLGVTMVAQELSLVPTRSVVANVFLGIEHHRGPLARNGADRRSFARLVEQYGMDLDPDQTVSSLSVADQQKVEIMRALARDADLIVMDEPTARLTSDEAKTLRRTVCDLAARGVTIVYVSHFLDEVLAIADTITIMRDGTIVRTSPVTDETHESLIEGIIGRSLDAAFPARHQPPVDAPTVLEVKELGRAGSFADVSFDIRAGEIVALAGLVGSGRTEIARTVFGADQPTTGVMKLDGEPFAPRAPRDAIRAGVAMVPESRKTDGLFPERSVRENMTLAHLGDFVNRFGILRQARERAAAERTARAVDLTGATIDSTMAELSGGNQQKSLFGRWLVSRPRLFIADEPTRGVDVGAKRGIYDLLTGLAASGMAVLVVSSELEEVLGIAHRILVMREGRIVGELEGSQATEADVMILAFGAPVA